MDPQKIIRHISFYDRKPARKPKMFAGDQMTSRQFGGWKQVTTAISIQSHQLCVFFSRKKKQFEREVNIRSTPFNDDLKTDTPLFFIGIN